MLECWLTDPNKRPTFADLRTKLKEMEQNHKVRINNLLNMLRVSLSSTLKFKAVLKVLLDDRNFILYKILSLRTAFVTSTEIAFYCRYLT